MIQIYWMTPINRNGVMKSFAHCHWQEDVKNIIHQRTRVSNNANEQTNAPDDSNDILRYNKAVKKHTTQFSELYVANIIKIGTNKKTLTHWVDNIVIHEGCECRCHQEKKARRPESTYYNMAWIIGVWYSRNKQWHWHVPSTNKPWQNQNRFKSNAVTDWSSSEKGTWQSGLLHPNSRRPCHHVWNFQTNKWNNSSVFMY